MRHTSTVSGPSLEPEKEFGCVLFGYLLFAWLAVTRLLLQTVPHRNSWGFGPQIFNPVGAAHHYAGALYQRGARGRLAGFAAL